MNLSMLRMLRLNRHLFRETPNLRAQEAAAALAERDAIVTRLVEACAGLGFADLCGAILPLVEDRPDHDPEIAARLGREIARRAQEQAASKAALAAVRGMG